MSHEQLTAEQMQEAAVSFLAEAGGSMSFEAFADFLKTNLGLMNTDLFRGQLIASKKIELMGDENVRLPFTPPTPAEHP